MDDQIKNFWARFLELTLTPGRPQTYSAWSFGNTEAMADNLGDLVLRKVKRATTSLAWIYETFPDEKMPVVGEHSIILNFAKKPLCIIKTSSVTIRKFSEIDEDYARTEGEGDGSLEYWRECHWKFFEGECLTIGRKPHDDMCTAPLKLDGFRAV